jgi:hypothetical protein
MLKRFQVVIFINTLQNERKENLSFFSWPFSEAWRTVESDKPEFMSHVPQTWALLSQALLLFLK